MEGEVEGGVEGGVEGEGGPIASLEVYACIRMHAHVHTYVHVHVHAHLEVLGILDWHARHADNPLVYRSRSLIRQARLALAP